MERDDFISVAEASGRFNVSPSYLTYLIKCDKIGARLGPEKVCGREIRMVSASEVKEYLTANARHAARRGVRRGNGVALSSGEIAKILGCAARTVVKWIDRGEMTGAYRLPGSRDRRVPVMNVLAFMRKNGMPTGALGITHHAVFVAVDDVFADAVAGKISIACESAKFARVSQASAALARLAGSQSVDVAVLDGSLGTQNILDMMDLLDDFVGERMVAVLVNEDDGEGGRFAHRAAVYRKPADPAALASTILAYMEGLS